MKDNEDRLRRLLNEALDAEGGNRPVPGPFRSERVGPIGAGAHGRAPRPRPWLLPWAAAACVAAIAGIAVAAVDAGSNSAAPANTAAATVHSSNPPTSAPPSAPPTPSTSASSRAPKSSSHPVVAPVTTSTNPTSSSPSVAQTWTTERIGDAQIGVPPGWEVRSGDSYAAVQQLYQSEARHTYCLAPKSLPYGARIIDCPILFAPIDFPAPDDGYWLTPDDPGGLTRSRSLYCAGGTPTVTGSGGERTLGGRAAEYRRLDYHCPGSARGGTLEQYEVLTRPAYLVVGQVDQSGVQQALAGVLGRTRLPAQDQSLRLHDYGYLRKVTPVANGVQVQLQRVVRASGAVESSTLYEYTIPQETLDMNAQHPAVGQLAAVYSDGRSAGSVGITTFDKPPAY